MSEINPKQTGVEDDIDLMTKPKFFKRFIISELS